MYRYFFIMSQVTRETFLTCFFCHLSLCLYFSLNRNLYLLYASTCCLEEKKMLLLYIYDTTHEQTEIFTQII